MATTSTCVDRAYQFTTRVALDVMGQMWNQKEQPLYPIFVSEMYGLPKTLLAAQYYINRNR